MFIIDFGSERTEADCAKYEGPFLHLLLRVKDERTKNKRALYAKYWWRHVEARPGMLAALKPLPRFVTTVRVSKYRLFRWFESPTLPDSSMFAFARDDDYFFGVLHSRFHEVWGLKLEHDWKRVRVTRRRHLSKRFHFLSLTNNKRSTSPRRRKD
jgi:hypothetical protein